MKTCSDLAHAIAHATKHFLATAAFTPTKRQDAANELQTLINHTEPQVEQYASDPNYAQLLVNLAVAKQELTSAGVKMSGAR